VSLAQQTHLSLCVCVSRGWAICQADNIGVEVSRNYIRHANLLVDSRANEPVLDRIAALTNLTFLRIANRNTTSCVLRNALTWGNIQSLWRMLDSITSDALPVSPYPEWSAKQEREVLNHRNVVAITSRQHPNGL